MTYKGHPTGWMRQGMPQEGTGSSQSHRAGEMNGKWLLRPMHHLPNEEIWPLILRSFFPFKNTA